MAYCNDTGCANCTTGKRASDSSALLSRALSTEEMIHRQRQYIEAIQPFIRVRAGIMAIQPVSWTRSKVSGFDQVIRWLPGSKESFDMVDQIIEQIGKEILQAR